MGAGSKRRLTRRRPYRLLYIAFPFPPSRGAGVYRTVAVANHFANAGWEVTVIAPETSYFVRYQGSDDPSLLNWISPNVKVVRVPLTNWLREDTLTRLSLFRAIAPQQTAKWIRSATRRVSPLDHYPFWFGPAFRHGLREGLARRFDVIMATGNPFASFAVAFAVGKVLNVPYVLDYRDAWTFDQFTGDVKHAAEQSALALERRILHNAAAVMTVNSSILDWLTDAHDIPSKVRTAVVQNGFDSWLSDGSLSRISNTDRTVRFLHVGTLIPEKMDWVSKITEFTRTASKLDVPVHLDVYGYLGFSTAQATQLQHIFESEGPVSYHGPVDKNKVGRLYQEADVLYLPLYDSPYVTSGKVYEMMSTAKPILAWGLDEAGALAPLRGYPKLVRADSRYPRSWIGAMRASIALSTIESKELDELTLRYASQYERLQSLKPMLRLLDDIAASRNRPSPTRRTPSDPSVRQESKAAGGDGS